MEDNLHNDRLEEFLRRSLEGHSEAPPGDLWSKIAANLEPPVATPTPMRVRHIGRWWAVAAAAVVVMGLFAAQHFYLSNKIARLSKDLQQLEQQQRLVGKADHAPTSIAQAQEEGVAPQQPAEAQPTLTTESPAARTTAPVRRSSELAGANGSLQKMKGQPSGVPDVQAKALLEQPAPLATNGQVPVSQASDPQPISQKAPSEAMAVTEEQQVGERANTADLQKLWLKRLSIEQQAAMPVPNVNAVLSIDPLRASSKITVGLNAMPMVSRGEVKSVKHDGPEPEPGQGRPKPSFDLDAETTGQAWMAGAFVEAEVAPRLRVGTGVNYRYMDYETTHEICLPFKERKRDNDPHEPHDREHDFNYDLNTAVGTVEMQVRAESSEDAEDIPADEKVEAEVKTSQQLSYINVPIYLNYSLGKGRLRVLAKGGVMLNFLRENNFQVGPIKSLNDKFQFKDKPEQRGSHNDLQTVTVDYVAGLGLEYRLNRALSLRLEPTVVGAMTSLHNNPNIESSEISAGINMGMTYSF